MNNDLPPDPIILSDLEKIFAQTLPWEILSNKSILVTGVSGLLGGYILRALIFISDQLSEPAKITALVRTINNLDTDLKTTIEQSETNLIVHDLCLPLNAIDKFDYILHCASPCTPTAYGKSPVSVLLPNTVGTASLLSLCKPSGTLVFLSSAEVCGNITEMPIGEDIYIGFDHLEARACYGEAKRAGESLCANWSRQYGLKTIITRLFHTYGPTVNLGDGRVFSDFLQNVLHGRSPYISSDGRAIRSFCYITDAVTGIFTAMFFGRSCTAYNIGNPDGRLSIDEFAKLLTDLTNIDGVLYGCELPEGYIPSKLSESIPDISRITELGWRPHIGPREGFLRTLISFNHIRS